MCRMREQDHGQDRKGDLSASPAAAAPAPHQAPVHVSSGHQDTCLSKAPFMDEPGTLLTSLNMSDVHGAAPPWPWATLSFWVPVAHDHVMVDGTTTAPRCQYCLSPGRCRGRGVSPTSSLAPWRTSPTPMPRGWGTMSSQK